jgi:hypothetical protein
MALGSVSQRVVAEAGCSVRVARGRAGVRDQIRILIGLDDSPSAKAAVAEVARRSWLAGTQALVVTVHDQSLARHPDLDRELRRIDQMQWEADCSVEVVRPASATYKRAD